MCHQTTLRRQRLRMNTELRHPASGKHLVSGWVDNRTHRACLNRRVRAKRVNIYVKATLVLLWMCNWTSGAEFPDKATQTETNRLDFEVFWPPKGPSETPVSGAKPLLNGCVILRREHSPDGSLAAHLRIMLIRPSDEAGRKFWNSRLAFPEYDWMRYVRVWDADNRWLWPNLSYLLRLHGVERVERYGGVDPGKGVDNDFAAVLIRKFDASGQNEDEATRRAPLVAAEWYPVGTSGAVDKQTIVHTVQSDEFMLILGRPAARLQGLAAVWLIYADFMGAKLSEAWPKAPEFAGGILAYFELQWDLKAEAGQELSLRQLVPKRSTGFDWERWAPRTRAAQNPKTTSKLSDVGDRRHRDGEAPKSEELKPEASQNAATPHR
jgi:hypothetical protein